MTDDGQIVKMTQQEYEALIGRVMRSFMTANHVWDFPWQGTRLVYIEQGELRTRLIPQSEMEARSSQEQ